MSLCGNGLRYNFGVLQMQITIIGMTTNERLNHARYAYYDMMAKRAGKDGKPTAANGGCCQDGGPKQCQSKKKYQNPFQ